MWIEYNSNPRAKRVGDCAVRAIARALNQTWDETYADLTIEGLILADMPDSNAVWGAYLSRNGWHRHIIPSDCPDCYSVEDFCNDHPKGTYILAISGHVVPVEDGNWIDSWNSCQEIPLYYWCKGECKHEL